MRRAPDSQAEEQIRRAKLESDDFGPDFTIRLMYTLAKSWAVVEILGLTASQNSSNF